MRLNILHLSDFHFRDSEAEKCRRLGQLLAESTRGNRVDVIVFSGDLVNSVDDSFDNAYNALIAPTQTQHDLSNQHVLVVPGNHDKRHTEHQWVTGLTSRQWSGTLMCALMHLLVDGLCVCCLYLMAGGLEKGTLAPVFVTYTVIAFLTQPLSGLLADHAVRYSNLLVLAAVALLAFGVGMASVGSLFAVQPDIIPFFTTILLGLGNSLFHVWGGKRVAFLSHNDIRALSLYVATGAMGLALGMVFASWWLLYGLLTAVALLAVVASTKVPKVARPLDSRTRGIPSSGGWAWGAVLLLMVFVCLRSFLGESLTEGVPKGGSMILLIGGITMLGKAVGGWVAKGIGLWTTLIGALAGTLVCLWMAGSVSWLWMAGVLLINLTMAVTLYWCNKAMQGREGFAFGLLAAALMPGYLLAQIPDASLHLPQLAINLTLTVAIEVGILWLLREKRADVLWSVVTVNILTNIPLNLCLIYFDGGWVAIAIGEVLVVLTEAVWYRFFTCSWKLGAIYSVLCNVISFLCGLLIFLFKLLFL